MTRVVRCLRREGEAAVRRRVERLTGQRLDQHCGETVRHGYPAATEQQLQSRDSNFPVDTNTAVRTESEHDAHESRRPASVGPTPSLCQTVNARSSEKQKGTLGGSFVSGSPHLSRD